MGIFDNIMPGVASTLIGVFGNPGVLRDPGRTYNDVTGDTVTKPIDYPVSAAPPKAYSLMQVNGDTIIQGDVVVMIAAKGLSVVPAPGMVLILGGQNYQVISANAKMAGLVAAAWELQCRK